MTVMRRMMLRISEIVASKRGILSIATGESLGQVASQTLESMHAINAVTSYPVLRPLITTDKNEIIEIAKKLTHIRSRFVLLMIVVQFLYRDHQKQSRKKIKLNIMKIN